MKKIFWFHAFRLFSPIIPFITPYFVEKKNIKNSTFHSKVIPFFFISSLIFGIIGPFFVEIFGEKIILICETICELSFLCSFHFIPQNGVLSLILMTTLHGMSTSFNLLTKNMLYADGGNREKLYALFNTVKRTSGVFSGLVGQDLYFASGSYTPALILSIITSFIATIISFFLKSPAISINTEKNPKYKVFTRQHIFFSLLNIVGSTIYISFIVYSASIFIERKKNRNVRSNIFGKILYNILYPLRLISLIFLQILSFFTKVEFHKKFDDEKLIFGYIDALSRLISIFITYSIGRYNYGIRILSYISLLLVFPIIFSTFAMGRTNTLFGTYIFYILGSTTSNCLLVLTHAGFNKVRKMAILTGINLTISSIIHISINFISKINKLPAQYKMYLYLITSSVLYVSALIVWFIIGRFAN